jgi:hypothetical protein
MLNVSHNQPDTLLAYGVARREIKYEERQVDSSLQPNLILTNVSGELGGKAIWPLLSSQPGISEYGNYFTDIQCSQFQNTVFTVCRINSGENSHRNERITAPTGAANWDFASWPVQNSTVDRTG